MTLFPAAWNTIYGQISILDRHLYLHGDVRTGYFSQQGINRDGSTRSIHEIRNRTRIGLGGRPTGSVEWRTRYSIRVSSHDFQFKPGRHTTAAGNNGLLMGEGAFDMAYIRWMPDQKFHIRAGRMQTGFTLPGVIENALILGQSPNTDIEWTDGVHAFFALTEKWETDFVIEFHHKNAPTHTMRTPLDIPGSSVPLTFFSQFRHLPTHPLFELFALDLLYSPDALVTDAAGKRTDYIITSVKTVISKQLSENRKLTWGIETSWTFTRPNNYMTGLAPYPVSAIEHNNTSRAGGAAIQTNISVTDLIPGHKIGFITALVGPSTLTSSDYWNNQLMAEIRYVWQLTNRLSCEIRARYRGDHKQFHGTETRRKEIYSYARLTYRLR